MDLNAPLIQEEKTQETEEHENFIDEDETYDGIDEEKHLIILWRFDQGAGAKVMDITNNNVHGNLLKDKALISNEEAEYIWENGELERNDPLDFEDQWGKESPSNWCLSFFGQESLRVRGSKALSQFKGHFTFQVWIKMEEFKEFLIFKRQAEDFNLRFKDPGVIEISREHNTRNILTLNLSTELKMGEWTHLCIIYRQFQHDESDPENCGLKIYLNLECVFQDSKINFKRPLIQTHGLFILESFVGKFTELRFWNINLNYNIIKETYKRPLDCVNELRNKIQMKDDQFMTANKKKPRGKRGTLIAPPGKGLGLKGALKALPRGSVKVLQHEELKLQKEFAEEIKEETDADGKSDKSDTSKSHSEELDQSHHSDKDSQNEDQEKSQTKDQNQALEEKIEEAKPVSEKITKNDEFNFEFNTQQNPKEEKDLPKNEFWAEDAFNSDPKPNIKANDNFDEFSWGTQPKQTQVEQDDAFGWGAEDKTNKKEESFEFDSSQQKPNQSQDNDAWGFDNSNINPSPAKIDADFDYNFEVKDTNSEQNLTNREEHHEVVIEESKIAENSESQANENIDSTKEEIHSEIHENADNIESDRESDEKENNEEQYNSTENNEQKDEQSSWQQNKNENDKVDFYNFESNTGKERYESSPAKKDSFDDFNFSNTKESNIESSNINAEVEFEHKTGTLDDFEFNQNHSLENDLEKIVQDESQEKPKIENKNDFDFDFNSKPQTSEQNKKEDDFNFGSQSKPKTNDFDFDFGNNSNKQQTNTAVNNDFDNFFANSSIQVINKPTDSFDSYPSSQTQEKDENSWDIPSSNQAEEIKKNENNEEHQQIPKVIKVSNEMTQHVFSAPKNSLRKASLELHEFTEETNSFMEECVKIIQEEVSRDDYEGALITIESNMNELIYDYKELERNKNNEPEEEYSAKVKELKTNIRFLTFYKLSMKVCIQVCSYRTSKDPKDLELSASLANILVLPPVHEEVKKIFYWIAIDENMHIKNYKVALKLLYSFEKQIKNINEVESERLEKFKVICNEHKEDSKHRFESVVCPKCSEHLPFGHATPSCSGCNTKILFCNETLVPLVPETAIRCYICFATYDKDNYRLFIPNDPSLCPNCRFGKLKSVLKMK